MNRKALVLAALLLPAFTALAQQPFATLEYIDVNNIKAGHLVHGDMWWRVDDTSSEPDCEYPKGSGKHVGYGSSFWMAGYNGSNLQASAELYRQSGTDYWPGPASTNYQTAQAWARIWKIGRNQLDSFLAITSHTVANTPKPILEWPAKGNPFARGNNNAQLQVLTDMAPFVDVNNDGIYNPLSGDHPVMKGDQMLWSVFNTDGPSRSTMNPTPMAVEVHRTVYAYRRWSVADDIVFYEFDLRNSGNTLDSFRAGLYADMDLGFQFDDYIGFDSARRLGITYNGRSVDGSGQTYAYGQSVPMAGVTLLETPGDAPGYYEPAGTFNYFNSGFSFTSAAFYHLLHARDHVGMPFMNNSRYRLDEDDECLLNHVPGERRFVLASNTFTFPASSTRKIAMALVVAPDAGGCPNMDFAGIKEVTDTAWKLYRNPLPPIPLGVHAATSHPVLRIFPNPAQDLLTVVTTDDKAGTVTVYDALGKAIRLEQSVSGNSVQLYTSPLAAGVYTLIYRSKNGVHTRLFVKE